MTDKSLKIGAFLLFIVFSTLVSFSFFCMSVTHNQNLCKNIENEILTLTRKADSLEHIINIDFKERKDTIMINVVPQQIKVYYNKEK